MRRSLPWLLLVGLAGACNQSDFGYKAPPDEPPSGLGTEAWGNTDISCASDADCNPGEGCQDNLCQMKRCEDGPYESRAPIGEKKTLRHDRELVVADFSTYQGSYWLDGYAPGDDQTVTYPDGGSTRLEGKATDVAGGDFFGKRPESTAAIVAGRVVFPREQQTLDVGFVPLAIAAGDVDADGLDELVAIAAGGEIAVCHADTGACEQVRYSQAIEGLDVAVGDVDGDGFAEPIFLVERDGDVQLRAWNRDKAITGQVDTVILGTDRELKSITAGDIDGDEIAEVIGLEGGGWGGLATDTLATYGFAGQAREIGSIDTSTDALDISASDLDGDGVDEVVVLRGDEFVSIFSRSTTSARIAYDYQAELSVSGDPQRIATTDFDGDSPQGRLVEGPILVPGKVVPTMVLHIPPYSRTYSDGASFLDIGDARNTNASASKSVGLRASLTMGFEAEFPGIASVSVERTVEKEMTRTRTHETELSVGNRVWLDANPERYGDDYAAVFLSCACFHAYTYELDDPAGRLGGNGKQFKVLMPVGGASTVWSSKRYNKLAEALGNLPLVEVPYRIGDPGSYPTTFQHPDGTPVGPQEMVFPDPPTQRVSDVSSIGFSLTVTQTETNETAMQTNIDVSSSVEGFGLKIGGSLGVGFGEAYAVSVGEEAEFLGYMPPLPDDLSTPDDEYETYGYSMRPVVYRQTYTDANGNEAGYYVMSYAVGR
jgi:hypothetical protein